MILFKCWFCDNELEIVVYPSTTIYCRLCGSANEMLSIDYLKAKEKYGDKDFCRTVQADKG